jgi:hypothetical protein
MYNYNIKTPLTKQQKDIMQEFYSKTLVKSVLSKVEYNKIWKLCKNNQNISNIQEIEKICPAIICEINKSETNSKNLQSAVFSECVYAQTLANVFNLSKFYNYAENQDILPQNVLSLLSSYFLYPRYIYANVEKSRLLIQAGGCNGIDSALIQVWDNSVYSIEFKEQSARGISADLPKYKENGTLAVTKDFAEKYPWYVDMLNEHKTLNLFEIAGHNIYDFSVESIKKAIVNNYNNAKKYADVIVTADKNGFLTMLPANQVDIWAKLEGEIRAGRNKYKVWTPNKLKEIILENGGEIEKTTVVFSKNNIKSAVERGGEKVSRYKISPIFFVYVTDCKEQNGNIVFDIEDVWQLNPAITAKMFFRKLDAAEVKSYYRGELEK